MDANMGTVLPRVSLAELVNQWRQHVDDLLLHDPEGPQECLVRAGELVVPAEALESSMGRLDRWVDRVEHVEQAGLARLRLRPAERERCVQIAMSERDTLHGLLAANHVHIGSPVMMASPVMFGTRDRPGPAGPLAAPPNVLWDPPVVVAVLDSGLDPHPWFSARPWLSDQGLSPEVLSYDGHAGQDRQAGHGTFVAGVVLEHAPGVVLRHHRVLSSLGITDDVTVASAMCRVRRAASATGEHVDIVLTTAGCRTADDACPPLLHREILRYSDTVVVAAAGNWASDRPFWPAALPEVLAVAATDTEGALAPFSDFGDWIDAAALGVDVVSCFVRLEPAGQDCAPGTESRRYGMARWSGTSFAAPRVAAEVATLRSSGHTAAQARELACARHPFVPPVAAR